MKTKLKEHTIITTREFIRNFSKIGAKPTSKQYMVVKHGRPIMVVTPCQPETSGDWWSNLNPNNYPEAQPKQPIQKNHLTLKQLREKYSFHSGETNLSQRVDEIVYGIGR